MLSTEELEFINDEGTLDNVRVETILERSGIVFLDPADLSTPQYRFEPFWIHRYLVER